MSFSIHCFDRNASVAEVKDYIDRWGFAVVLGRPDPGTIADVRKDIERYGRGVEKLDLPFFGGALKKVEGLLAKSSGLVELMADPFVTELSERYLGADILLNASGGFILEPGSQPQPLHHDDVLYKPFVPRGTQETMVNFMFAVTDFTAENGATRMVPGSHRWPEGRAPTEDDEVIDLVMPAGGVAIWLGSTWHGAGVNRTDTARLGAEMAFNCGWLRPHEAYHLLIPPALARDFPTRVQDVIGYKAHRGMLGCIQQRSPSEILGFEKRAGSARSVVRAGEAYADPVEVEKSVRSWFAERDVPDEIDRLLKALVDINATRAGTSNPSDLNMLEVVAESQARLLADALRNAGLAEPIEQLRHAH
jgi:hypothetical protein